MEAVAARAEHGVYGYSFAGRDYISSVAGWFNREYGLGVEESWVCPTYGVVTALYFTILALTEPGDRVMIHTPIYDPVSYTHLDVYKRQAMGRRCYALCGT